MAKMTSVAQAAEDAVKIVSRATEEAATAIAKAAEQARKVVSDSAADAVRVLSVKNADGSSDHDILIELKTRMEGLKSDIKELNSGTSIRLDGLEKEKLNSRESYANTFKAEVDKGIADHETRLNALEKSKTAQAVLMSIGVGILTILVSLLIFHIMGSK